MPVLNSPKLKRCLVAMLLTALLLTGIGCVAPIPNGDATADDPATAAVPAAVAAAPAEPAPGLAPEPVRDTRTAPRPAPPMSDPLPPLRASERDAPRAPRTAPAAGPVEVDFSCTRDADCAIKDIGNCCGYYPACVNVNSPTDPAAVMAQCARSGMASVCGFPAITACQCVAGKCSGSSAAVDR